MTVGALLAQPQRLPRIAAAAPSDAGLGDVASLAIGVLIDAVKGGHILDTFEAAGEALGVRFATQAESGLDHARQRLAAMLEAPIAGLAAKAQELGATDGPEAALAAAHDVLTALVAIAEELTIDHIRQHLAEVLDIVETDLGLTPSFLETEVLAFVDDLVTRLEHVAPESNASLRSNRLKVIGAIRRLRRTIVDEVHFPALPVEQLSEELFALIQRSGIASEAARAACVGANLAGVTDAGRSLLHAVPFTGLGSGSIGAGTVPDPPADASETYLWYPSWLANNHRPFLADAALVVPGDEVVRSADRSQIVQRHMYGGADDTFTLGASGEWKDTPRLPGDDEGTYTFEVVSADAMETIAWISSIVCNGFELLFHLLSLEEGDYASNIVNAVGNTTFGTWKAIKREPFPNYLEGPVFRFLGTHLASFEGMHTKASPSNKFLMWLTLAGPDFAEMLSYKWWTGMVRDLVLSVLTLINHKPPANATADHPRNREEIDAVRTAVVVGLHNLFLLLFKREDWGLIKPGGDKSPAVSIFVFWSLLGGIGAGGLSGVLGCLAGEAIARDVSADALEKKVWWAIPQWWFTTIYWLYLQQEGHTSGGTYTPYGDPPFQGYPKPATSSPYRLPYDSAAVGSCYVGQANEGLFSHNFNNVKQVYAYDFSLDQDDEILAARDGTVVGFAESVPNDKSPDSSAPSSTLTTAIAIGTFPGTIDIADATGFAQTNGILFVGNDVAFYLTLSGNTFQGVTWKGGTTVEAHKSGDGISQQLFTWNWIAIRHDSPDGTHDRDQGGASIKTVAVYGHGRTGSVSAAFARHSPPVPTAQIVNTPVKQGMPIMDAGCTGISFHNHLHMHVVKDPAYSSYLGWGGSGATIPFVFSDSDVGGDGVPTHFNWYKSANVRRLA